ncbi:hypothetical protein [Butyrivibrio proteoclasticus]|uniref:hypothetical protein n=1 Tax=Butyrivibrio proteoclasticus TaxID=43305 RepID=UPI000B1DF8F9|nr:hypothetical protein [Butyrivibrio proteoclasticus]
MKKLLKRLPLLIIPVLIYVLVVYVNDIFNVFHYDNIRQTSASGNENYIKTRYVIENPDKFNAFILGSSRVANLPKDGLPSELNGDMLSWYNMTYPMGCPKDNLETIKTFLKNGVDVKYVVMGIDEISMYRKYEENAGDLIYKQYQEYEASPIRFFYSYLKVKPDFKVLKESLSQTTSNREETRLFYDYGVEMPNLDVKCPEKDAEMVGSLGCGYYGGSESIDAIKELVILCQENGIELKIFTSPVLESTYREAVSKGYLDFLSDVAGVTDFYNFSGLNEYTTDMRFYFDASHYKPYVGLQIEKCLFDSKKESDVAVFGAYITESNVNELIARLEDECK